jgi:hypothetical protein
MRRTGETGKLNRPGTKMKVVRDSLAGKTQAEIGRELGVGRSTISRFLTREDVAALVERERLKIASLIRSALDNVESLVLSMPTAETYKDRELAYRASTRVLEAGGLLPGPPDTNALIQINNQMMIGPGIRKAFQLVTTGNSIKMKT